MTIPLQLKNADEKPTALIIRVSLRMLSSKSSSYAEASKLLTSTIEKLNAAVQKLYKNNAVVAVVTVDSHHHHSRSKRQAAPKQAVDEVSGVLLFFKRILCSFVVESF